MSAKIGIEVKDLRKRLGPNQALGGVSTDFAPGLIHGIIGPEGAGKTTLLRTLVGLLTPDSGDLVFSNDGQAVPFAKIRPSIAYMPQQQSLYPDLSVREHLDFFRELYQIPKSVYEQRSRELLHVTRLERFEDRAAGKLSGGMYKKLGLMCSLLQSPTLMLLDEPTNGVDPISRREFWELLYGLAEKKILIIVATAYMDEAERCGRVHLLDGGVMLGHGEPHELLKDAGVRSFDELFIKRARPEVV
jgi:ABC-2 type transport system ATP-binding protein